MKPRDAESHLARRLGWSGTADTAWCGHEFTGRDKKVITLSQLRKQPRACKVCPVRYLAAPRHPVTVDGRPK
jgi:hypothetical protein